LKESTKLVLAASLAVVVAVAAFGAYSLAPRGRPPSGGSATTDSLVTGSGGTCASTPETFGNMTLEEGPCVSYGFPSGQVAYATLESAPTHDYIRTAYGYQLLYFGTSVNDPRVTYAVLNVTGSQEVAGNWTTGYEVSYTGNRLLNVTLLQLSSSSYEVIHFSDYPLPDRNQSVSYSPDEVQAIDVALSDPQITSYMSGLQYYAEHSAPIQNATVNGYYVQFFQVDGPGTVGAFVNQGLTAVTSSHFQLRVSGQCWPDGYFIADPWSAVSSSACTTEVTTTSPAAPQQ